MDTKQRFLGIGFAACALVVLCPTGIAQDQALNAIPEQSLESHERSHRDQAIWILRSIRLPEPPLEDPIGELAVVLPFTADDLLGYLHDRKIPKLEDAPAQTMSIYQHQLILDAVEQCDSRHMLAAVARRLQMSDSILNIATAIEIYGVTGGSERLSTIRTHVDALTDERPDPRLVKAIEGALIALMRRDVKTQEYLGTNWRNWPSEMVPVIVRAVGKARDPRGLELLHEVIRWEGELQLLALSQIGLLGPSGDEYIDEPLANTVRQMMLEVDDGRIRKAAILALGGLQDIESIPLMIEILDSENSGERGNAVWALRKASGMKLNERAQIWSVWFEQEMEWYASSSDVFRQLDSPVDDQVFDAIREVSLHSLHRDELAREVSRCLGHSRVSIRITACKALARLGSRAVVPELVSLLLDRAESVRLAARKALTEIHGEDYGPNIEDWPNEAA